MYTDNIDYISHLLKTKTSALKNNSLTEFIRIQSKLNSLTNNYKIGLYEDSPSKQN